MNPSLMRKLEGLHDRFEEVGVLLADAETIADIDRLRSLAQEHAELSQVADRFEKYNRIIGSIDDAQGILDSPEKELHPLAHEEIEAATEQRDRLEREIKLLLIPADPADDGNAWLEIRAGTGGDEAALFAGDLFRMYLRYAASRRWQTEIAGESLGELGGYKEIVARITGPGVYSRLKFESGVHRVQRVPETESQGRIHTSACTVAVLPEAEAIENVKIDAADLRIDTFRASGAGGQHVNKTDSAIRITHLPTGTVVECQDERSQHKNRARAMSLLGARLLDAKRREQDTERALTRRLLIGSGDRSQRIRTYNFPQKRISDHRINLSLYRIHEIMAGDLDEIIDSLINEDRADQLAALGG